MSDDLFRVQEIAKKRLRLRKSKKQEWVEASFVEPEIHDEVASQYGKTDGYLGTIFTSTRFSVALGIVLVFLGGVVLRSAHLQIVQGAEYRDQANSNRLRIEHVRADRGLIFDRFHTPLVRNIPNYVATIQPYLLPSDNEERHQLLTSLYSDYLLQYRDDTLADFLTEMETAYGDPKITGKDIPVADFLKQDDAILLDIMSDQIDALSIDLLSRREYLNEGPVQEAEDETVVYPPVKSLSHILGYLSSLREGEYTELANDGYLFNDVVGRSGLEYIYEKELRGNFGKQSIEVDAFGNQKQVLTQDAPIDGMSLVTTLDIEFQRAVENIVQQHLEEYEKKRASVVVMNPQNGQVLSLVSLPTFNNNDFAKGIKSEIYTSLLNDEDNPLFNRSISGEYPSGSTFKPIVAAAALEEGIITPNTTFISNGGIRINVWFFPDWRAGGHGRTNIYHALADSVNTYFYIIGGGYDSFEGLGVDRISAYASEFHLSQPLGIDLPSEQAGFLPSKKWKEETKNERWYIGDTYHLAIGQGDLLVTPLQVASYFATFANGGTVYKPYLVSAMTDKNQNIIREVDPVILNKNFISEEHIDTVQTGLRRVVTQGSGRILSGLSIPVSGKTGTAQWHSEKPPHAWFAGYAPSDNPQLAFSILVEEGEEGSGITASIANDMMKWWIENRSVSQE
jgi:penicillin-binding protein 2